MLWIWCLIFYPYVSVNKSKRVFHFSPNTRKEQLPHPLIWKHCFSNQKQEVYSKGWRARTFGSFASYRPNFTTVWRWNVVIPTNSLYTVNGYTNESAIIINGKVVGEVFVVSRLVVTNKTLELGIAYIKPSPHLAVSYIKARHLEIDDQEKVKD